MARDVQAGCSSVAISKHQKTSQDKHNLPANIDLKAFLAASLYNQWSERKRVLEQSCRLACLSVCRSVRWVNCGKMADWMWMPFVVVSGSFRVGYVRWKWRPS